MTGYLSGILHITLIKWREGQRLWNDFKTSRQVSMSVGILSVSFRLSIAWDGTEIASDNGLWTITQGLRPQIPEREARCHLS